MTDSQVQVWISLGSNHDRHHQISRALDGLHQAFGELTISQVYETQPVGLKVKKCAPFYNLVAGFYTQLQPGELNAFLKQLEAGEKYLRPTDQSTYVRALDLDILLWGEASGNHDGLQLPYKDLLKHDFVLRPMAELAPNLCPPGSQQTFLQLWQTHQHPDQLMQAVDFTWQGRQISFKT
ncbi:2-amino-4-hydroxy-6-hydroxymethyldihydropteridine diphosphokinase [Marinospirillum alkaliphilum]|uniref:2-amino-4-hydroxy-6-hydroxymethyldihydropteridine diphosphokinase n=1 Tax=Marinospirillum alkaliphilum DSM 21637 TaxID=1122209 RepID=A0A1K1VIP7_9GAMM|nr:2-amino-4-hydroxy-6-hydroxymethyldihydropteridine diphosphokinase [Marinospirillum alkaliphilum]SFX24651.1 2-amino-4-hydroxy-6-hydroxymethyldihydropteridinediphosphokinase [Marinospirillum alkaliphilum DSM 21637]